MNQCRKQFSMITFYKKFTIINYFWTINTQNLWGFEQIYGYCSQFIKICRIITTPSIVQTRLIFKQFYRKRNRNPSYLRNCRTELSLARQRILAEIDLVRDNFGIMLFIKVMADAYFELYWQIPVVYHTQKIKNYTHMI